MFPQVTPKQKKTSLVLIYVLSAFVLLVGIIFLVLSLQPIPELNPAVPLNEVDTDKNYYFEELWVVDLYASRENDDDEMYVYVAYVDEDGKTYLASFTPDKDDALLKKINAYLEDDSLYVGDLSISAAVSVTTVTQKGDDLKGFYDENLPIVKQMFRSNGMKVEDTDLHFTYEGSDPEDYEARQRSEANGLLIGGIVFALIGLAMMIFLPRMMKKKWAKMEAAAQAAQREYMEMNTPSAPTEAAAQEAAPTQDDEI